MGPLNQGAYVRFPIGSCKDVYFFQKKSRSIEVAGAGWGAGGKALISVFYLIMRQRKKEHSKAVCTRTTVYMACFVFHTELPGEPEWRRVEGGILHALVVGEHVYPDPIDGSSTRLSLQYLRHRT